MCVKRGGRETEPGDPARRLCVPGIAGKVVTARDRHLDVVSKSIGGFFCVPTALNFSKIDKV